MCNFFSSSKFSAFLVSVPTTAYITYILIDDNMPRTPFIENIQTKEAERPAIIVQEELRRIYVSFFLVYEYKLFWIE